MSNQNKISFSLRKLLLVPVIFAALFWLIPEPAAVGYVSVSAIALSLLLFLIKIDNLTTIITCALGCLIGGSMGMPILHSSKGPRPTMDRKLIEITIGVICGYLFFKLLEWISEVWVKYMKKGYKMAGKSQGMQKNIDAKQSETS